MKLTNEDKKLIKEWNFSDKDIDQIERASKKTLLYEINNKGRKRISIQKAIEILGREKLLSGYARSSFHYNTSRENNGRHVLFNAFPFFRAN